MGKGEIFVAKHGLEKSVKQIKANLSRLREAYKQAEDNNPKTGSSPKFSPYYQDFDQICWKNSILLV